MKKKDTQTLLIVGFVIIAMTGAMLWGFVALGSGPANHAGAPMNSKPSTLTATEKLFDFGTISMKNGKVQHEFAVTNNTQTAVNLPKVYTSCMCTTAYLETPSGEKGPFGMEGMGYVPPANDTIAPGETRTVKVVFDPNAHGPAGVGSIDRFIYLQDDQGGALTLEIKAVVTP